MGDTVPGVMFFVFCRCVHGLTLSVIGVVELVDVVMRGSLATF